MFLASNFKARDPLQPENPAEFVSVNSFPGSAGSAWESTVLEASPPTAPGSHLTFVAEPVKSFELMLLYQPNEMLDAFRYE